MAEPAPAVLEPALTTLDRTITAGVVRRNGRRGPYRALTYGPGEPHVARRGHGAAGRAGDVDDGVGGVGGVGGGVGGVGGVGGGGVGGGGRRARSLLRLVHFTDLQLADVQSPGRFEFFQELQGRPGSEAFVPAQRPQEALAAHACEAMARTLRRLGSSPVTGAPIGLALCTGDSIDNAQANELAIFMALLTGGVVVPGSGGPTFEGVQSSTWDNPLFWHPDAGTDQFKADWGFPEHPGLLQRAMAPFSASGVGVPWLSCFGNHDGLALGTAIPTPAYRAAVVQGRKAVGLPPGPDLIGREAELIAHPERFLLGPARAVAADPGRRLGGRTEFVAAHLGASGLPRGHGFSPANLAEGTAYAAYDGIEGTRVLLLDTTNLDGYHHGSIGQRQMRWLEERLIEVHSRFRSADGRVVTTTHADRLVVLASHHGLATLSNGRQDPAGAEDDHPRACAEQVRALLHRFGNVVLWLNGHRHLNEVAWWPCPHGTAGGIWEISTAAMADWPCQARVVELVVGEDGALSVLSTMVDHDVCLVPEHTDGLDQLASLHRELAANVPGAGLGSALAGRAEDRNVQLIMPMPFAAPI